MPAPPTPSLAEEFGLSLASLRDLESRIAGRLLAWVGAAAVLLGSVFFLSLAFSRGWIGPEGRVALGIVGGVVVGEAGVLLFGRRQEQLGHLLVALGLGIVSLSLFAGTRYYALYPPEWALAGSFLAALAAAAIAIHFDSQTIAIYGLLAIAAAPPLMGAGANLVTIGFLAVTVVGTTLISLAKSWRWLPATAFLITAPQLVYWLAARPDPGMAVPALAAFWLLNAIAASADELRDPAADAAPKHITDGAVSGRPESLFLVNSTLAVGAGLWVLSGDAAGWQGAYVGALALAHFAFGGYVIYRRGEADSFALLVNAIAATAVAIAIERQFNGAAVVIGWSVEAALLAAVFGFRKDLFAGGAAAILGAIEVVHLGAFEYSWLRWNLEGRSGGGAVPFADSSGVALAAILLCALAAGWMSERKDVRMGLLIVGSAITAYSLPYELTGASLVAAWAFEGAAVAAVWRFRRVSFLGVVGLAIGLLAIVHLLVYEYPLLSWSLGGSSGHGGFPFANSSGLALGGLLAAALAGGLLSRSDSVRTGLVIACSALVAYALPFELSGPALVAAWGFEAAALVAVWRFDRNDYLALTAASIAGLAVLHLGSFEYPLLSWNLAGGLGSGPFAFADSAGLALGSLLVAALVAGWVSGLGEARRWLLVAGCLVVAYALPYELTGPALVVAWSAEVVGLAALRRLDRAALAAGSRGVGDAIVASAFVVGGLSLLQIVACEYPLGRLSLHGIDGPGVIAFADPAAIALGAVLAGALLVGLLGRDHGLRCALTTGGLLLVAYSLPFELSGVALMSGWAALLPASIAAEGLLDRLPGVPPNRARLRTVSVIDMTEIHWSDSPLIAAAVASCLTLAQLFAFELPVSAFDAAVRPAMPFTDLASASSLLGIAAFLLAAAITPRPDLRISAILVATGIAANTVAFELALPYAVVAWCALAIVLGVWSLREKPGRLAYLCGASGLVAIAVCVNLGVVVPFDRLAVRSVVGSTGPWFAFDAIVAVGATVSAFLLASRFLSMPRLARSALEFIAGAGLVYLASAVVVDFFQHQVGGSVALEELQKQAQVGVSILWGLIGMGIFLAGTAGWRQGVREGGLGLLALATGKVFLFDLSYLDVAYRVLSLIGLGLLLLLGAFAYQSLRPRRPAGDLEVALAEHAEQAGEPVAE